jgi:uncharacterized protein with GYD domain
MATYVTLYNYTDQGIRNVKDTVKRAEAVKQVAAQAGVTIKEVYWLQGKYDVLVVSESPDETAAMALAVNTAKAGNVSGQTLRAFTATEMEKILAKVV